MRLQTFPVAEQRGISLYLPKSQHAREVASASSAHRLVVDRLRLPAPAARRATLVLPGDKSVSHRAFMLAAIARGKTKIIGANAGADVHATVAALRQVGVRIHRVGNAFVVSGDTKFRSPHVTIDCGNSGTTMRLLAGLLAGRVHAVLDGDASLRRRPMLRVAQPLNEMGADIETSSNGKPPLRLRACGQLHGVRVRVDVPSAQVTSAILLAAVQAQSATTIRVKYRVRDHTQRMLRAFCGKIAVRGGTIRVQPSVLTSPRRLEIFGDLSAAVYFACAGALVPGSHLRLRKIGVNPTRTAILDVLRAMGVHIEIIPLRVRGGEPAADLVIRGGYPLRCVPIKQQIVPQIIDEIPALCALAATAQGMLRIRGAAELRHKESDRIATTVALLKCFGAHAEAKPDGIDVRGGQTLRAPTAIDTHGDHRIGMAAAILAVATRAPLIIARSACIATSFPGFARAWRAAF